MKNKKIKNSHVLIIGSGQTLLLYLEKIKKFIEKDNIIIFGCNNMSNLIVPDYHFWGDKNRYDEFSMKMSNRSTPVFGSHLLKRGITKEHKKWKYKVLRYKKWKGLNKNETIKKGTEINYKKGIIYGPFRNIGALSIFYAYIKGAFEISVVGMDGYTLYSEKQLSSKICSQHCYGRGFSDFKGRKMKKRYNYYKEYEKRDKDTYKILHMMRDYGVNFKIITPTVFNKFYDPNVLGIGNKKIIK